MPDFRRVIDRRLARLRLAPTRRADIVEELSQHLQDRYRELRESGVPAADAERESHAELVRLARQLAGVEVPAPLDPPDPGAGGRTMLKTVPNDIRYALRTFARNPGFTAVVLLTLALGIGATTAIFSVLDGVMLRPLPYPDIDRILSLSERTTDGRNMSVSWPNFQDWRDQNQVFEHLGIYRPTTVNLTGGDRPDRLNASIASSAMFGAMGLSPIVGRVLSATEDTPAADRVAIVSERLWRNRFSGDPNLIGRSITLNGEPHTVIGIMPAAMRFPSRLTDVWLPIGLSVAGFPPRGAHPGLTAVGKLKPGVTLEQANADMDTIARRLEQQYPMSNKNTRVSLVAYYELVVRNIRPALLVLISAVGFVLLIGCANLANLMLSRAEARHREVAIRAALGAARGRLVQQLMVESLMLAIGGGLLGALFAFWAVKAFVASQPSTVPRIDLIAVDARVLLFTAGISILTGIVFGLAPALRATAPDLIAGLKEAARASTTPGSRRIRSSLIVVEGALAMVLLVGAGLTLRSFSRLMAIDPGFNPERVVTARLNLPDAKYPDRAAWTAFHREILQRLVVLPGVDSVGLNSAIPLEGGGSEAPVIAEGDPMPSPDRPATATLFQTTSPGYLRAMGIQLIKGRDFADRDTAATAPVVIVDETLVRKVFHDADPIGKRLAFEMRGMHGEGEAADLARGRRRRAPRSALRPRHRAAVRPALYAVRADAAVLRGAPAIDGARRSHDARGRGARRIDPAGTGRDRSRHPALRAADDGCVSLAKHGATAPQRRPTGRLQRPGAAAGGRRHLRRPVVYREPAHAGDRHPAHSRRDPPRRARAGRWRRHAVGDDRHRHRARGVLWRHRSDEGGALRGLASRSGHICRARRAVDRRGFGSEHASWPPRHARQPDRRATPGVT
jgi:predicted permease